MKTKRVAFDFLPCPFCGSFEVGLEAVDDEGLTKFVTLCNSCGGWGPQNEDADEAAKAWNVRFRIAGYRITCDSDG